MLHMRLMPQAVEVPDGGSGGITVDFDTSVQSMAALDAAAYRLIGTGTCQIYRVADRYVCRLTPSVNLQKRHISESDLKERFLNIVADENLRARVAEKTKGVRNVILALAFGSLAASQEDPG
jgi:His-Xaa-Ser system protein HxsD